MNLQILTTKMIMRWVIYTDVLLTVLRKVIADKLYNPFQFLHLYNDLSSNILHRSYSKGQMFLRTFSRWKCSTKVFTN